MEGRQREGGKWETDEIERRFCSIDHDHQRREEDGTCMLGER
jgi:hypothetical protein